VSLSPLPPTRPPAGYAAAPARTLSPQGIEATVLGHEPDGSTTLHSRLGTLKIFTAQPLPTGSKLILRIEPQAPGDMQAAPALLSEPMEEITSLAHDWKALRDAVQWAQANDPPLARALLQALPAADRSLASGLLFFLSAVKGGDLKSWLGGRLAGELDKKIPALAARLGADLAQMQPFAEAPDRQWSALMLPLMFGSELEHARFFYRKEEDKPGVGGTTDRGHRFILEVDLSHLGDLQFDGFVRQGARKKSFDLVIRSARPLAAEVAGDIRNLYEDALQATGYNGYLAFQQGSQHFIRPLAGLQAGSGGGAQPILA
jgi:hypothetical protein